MLPRNFTSGKRHVSQTRERTRLFCYSSFLKPDKPLNLWMFICLPTIQLSARKSNANQVHNPGNGFSSPNSVPSLSLCNIISHIHMHTFTHMYPHIYDTCVTKGQSNILVDRTFALHATNTGLGNFYPLSTSRRDA